MMLSYDVFIYEGEKKRGCVRGTEPFHKLRYIRVFFTSKRGDTMSGNMHKKQYCYSLFRNFDKIFSELDLVHSLNHSGEKGRESEEILKSFLNEYLPIKYSITTGFINRESGVSNLCDIVIYDSSNCPIFFWILQQNHKRDNS